MQQSRRPWTKDEDDAVMQIVDEVGLKNWPLVSTLMKQKYNVSGRSGKQCRERWHNQLNPEVNKKPWTEQEEKLLFEAHKTYRNRWIDISKLFEGRTDNSIKNHFYSTIRRSLRRICKLLGNKNSTSELRNIKPSILSKIFQYSELKGDQVTEENEHMVNESKIITEELLNFARSKPSKSIQNMEDGKRKNLQALIDKLNEFSKNYKSQKDSYRLTMYPRYTPIKSSKVIIVKSDEKSSSYEKQSSQVIVKQKNIATSKQKTQKKTYLYDWQQFEKRCLFVKQIFQNQTQSNRSDSPLSKSQEYDSQFQSQSLLNDFSLQEKLSDRAETYVTPRTNAKLRGFQPYHKLNQQDCMLDERIQCRGIQQKLKYELTNA